MTKVLTYADSMTEAQLVDAILEAAAWSGWRRAHFRPALLPAGGQRCKVTLVSPTSCSPDAAGRCSSKRRRLYDPGANRVGRGDRGRLLPHPACSARLVHLERAAVKALALLLLALVCFVVIVAPR
jgi:hypothetical protein